MHYSVWCNKIHTLCNWHLTCVICINKNLPKIIALRYTVHRYIWSRLFDHGGLSWWRWLPPQQQGREIHGALCTNCQRLGFKGRCVAIHDSRNQRRKVKQDNQYIYNNTLPTFAPFLPHSGAVVRMVIMFISSWAIFLQRRWLRGCLGSQRLRKSLPVWMWLEIPSLSFPLSTTTWGECPLTSLVRYAEHVGVCMCGGRTL